MALKRQRCKGLWKLAWLIAFDSCFFVTRAADANESEPCPAFLVPSVPNWALRLCAASFCATPESVGPRTFLQVDTASSPISSIAITGPELTNCTRLLLLKKKQLYAWCFWVYLWLKTHKVISKSLWQSQCWWFRCQSLLQNQPLHISQSLTQERLTWKKTLTDVPCKSPLPASCKKAIKVHRVNKWSPNPTISRLTPIVK